MKRGESSSASDDEDRISDLPDFLIHHILSFIDTIYAIRACVLSKRWRYIWTSLPKLEFCDSFYCFGRNDVDVFELDDEPTNDGFIKYVDKVLSRRDNNFDIQRFHLDCSTFYYTPLNKMYRWITIAVRRKVQELRIDTVAEDGFKIPRCLCTCESLTKMELKFTGWEDFNYENKIILPREMSLPRLKSLRLTLEEISFDDEKLTNRFFSSFPSLESLSMEMGWNADPGMNLYISLPKLEYFEFVRGLGERHSEVKLHAPSLVSFIYSGYMSTSFTLENLSSLVTANIEIRVNTEDEVPETYSEILSEKKEFYAQRTIRLLRQIQNVKVLTLNNSFLKALGGAPYILDTQPLDFYNLQHLKLQSYLSKECLRPIFCILKNSPNIESFSLELTQRSFGEPPVYPYFGEVKLNSENTSDYEEAGLFLPCMLHHLKVVEINGLLGSVNEIKFLEILLKHAIVLEKVVVASHSTKQDSLREKQMKKFSEMLLKFPRASKNIIILFQI